MKLLFKGILLAGSILLYVLNTELLIILLRLPLLFGIRLYHVLWLAGMLVMVKSMFPMGKKMASGKLFSKNYKEGGRKGLEKYTKETDRRAAMAFALWAGLAGSYFSLVRFSILPADSALVVVPFMFFMDSFCVHVWCPFRNWIIRNKCCNSCRIYHWGAWMIAVFLLVVPSFWTYSLFFMSVLMLFQWEFLHWRHPERFYEGSNMNLRCDHCRKRTGSCVKRTV